MSECWKQKALWLHQDRRRWGSRQSLGQEQSWAMFGWMVVKLKLPPLPDKGLAWERLHFWGTKVTYMFGKLSFIYKHQTISLWISYWAFSSEVLKCLVLPGKYWKKISLSFQNGQFCFKTTACGRLSFKLLHEVSFSCFFPKSKKSQCLIFTPKENKFMGALTFFMAWKSPPSQPEPTPIPASITVPSALIQVLENDSWMRRQKAKAHAIQL